NGSPSFHLTHHVFRPSPATRHRRRGFACLSVAIAQGSAGAYWSSHWTWPTKPKYHNDLDRTVVALRERKGEKDRERKREKEKERKGEMSLRPTAILDPVHTGGGRGEARGWRKWWLHLLGIYQFQEMGP